MSPASLKRPFITALRHMLRPVVRQLIAYGVSYPAFGDIVKQLYVEVAERDLPLPFKRQTDSRLAVLTGINRKEIGQIRRARQAEDQPSPIEDTAVTHIIGRWMAGPPYAKPGGAEPLPYEASDPATPSFSKLVRDAGSDIPIRASLDELLRVGAVALQPDGRVILQREAHIPPEGAEEKLTLLGTDPAELFSTIIHNIEHPDSARLQRKVVYDNIGSEALPAVRDGVREVGQGFIREANALIASFDRDRDPQAPGGARSRVVVGVYYFEEEVAPLPPPRSSEVAPPGRIKRSK